MEMERLSTLPAIKDLFPEHFVEDESVAYDEAAQTQQQQQLVPTASLSSPSSSPIASAASSATPHEQQNQQNQQHQQHAHHHAHLTSISAYDVQLPPTQPLHPHPGPEGKQGTVSLSSSSFSDNHHHHHLHHPAKRLRMARHPQDSQQQQEHSLQAQQLHSQQQPYLFGPDTVDHQNANMHPETRLTNEEVGLEEGEEGIVNGTKSRKHVCPHCGKRFNRPSSLKIHEHSHTGAKPFLCPYPNCGRTFSVSSNMRRHYRNHTQQKQLPASTSTQMFAAEQPQSDVSVTIAHQQQQQRLYANAKDARHVPQISVQFAKANGGHEERLQRTNSSGSAMSIQQSHSHSPSPMSFKYADFYHMQPHLPYAPATDSAPITPPYTNESSEVDQDVYRRSASASGSRVDEDIGGRSVSMTPVSATPTSVVGGWHGFGFPDQGMYGPSGTSGVGNASAPGPPANTGGGVNPSYGYGSASFQIQGFGTPVSPAPTGMVAGVISSPSASSPYAVENYGYSSAHANPPLDPALAGTLGPPGIHLQREPYSPNRAETDASTPTMPPLNTHTHLTHTNTPPPTSLLVPSLPAGAGRYPNAHQRGVRPSNVRAQSYPDTVSGDALGLQQQHQQHDHYAHLGAQFTGAAYHPQSSQQLHPQMHTRPHPSSHANTGVQHAHPHPEQHLSSDTHGLPTPTSIPSMGLPSPLSAVTPTTPSSAHDASYGYNQHQHHHQTNPNYPQHTYRQQQQHPSGPYFSQPNRVSQYAEDGERSAGPLSAVSTGSGSGSGSSSFRSFEPGYGFGGAARSGGSGAGLGYGAAAVTSNERGAPVGEFSSSTAAAAVAASAPNQDAPGVRQPGMDYHHRISASATPAPAASESQLSNQKRDDNLVSEGGDKKDKTRSEEEGVEGMGRDASGVEDEPQKDTGEVEGQNAQVKRKRTRTVDTTEAPSEIGTKGTKELANNVPNGAQRRKNTRQQKP